VPLDPEGNYWERAFGASRPGTAEVPGPVDAAVTAGYWKGPEPVAESDSAPVAGDEELGDDEPDREGHGAPSDEEVEARGYGLDAYEHALADPDDDDGTVYDDPEFRAELEAAAAARAEAAEQGKSAAAEAVQAAHEATQETVEAQQPVDAAAPAAAESAAESSGDGDGS
jgi:hypothetical protein